MAYQEVPELPSYQHLVLGLISGAVGPFTNAPIDTIKTRIQRATKLQGETAWSRITTVTTEMFKEEGPRAFYKGITPRVARVRPRSSRVKPTGLQLMRLTSLSALGCSWPSCRLYRLRKGKGVLYTRCVARYNNRIGFFYRSSNGSRSSSPKTTSGVRAERRRSKEQDRDPFLFKG
jgi:hypothetical protein